MTTPSLPDVMIEATDPASTAAGGRQDSRRAASPRTSFLLRRLGRMLVSLAIVVLATFSIVHLVPGDPVRAVLGHSAPAELVERTRQQLGLDDPLPVQFGDYVAGLVRGDLGVSLQTRRPVVDVLTQRLPATLVLAVSAFAVAALGSVPIGIATAISDRGGRRRFLDMAVSAVLGILITIPSFLLAVGLIAAFAIGLGVLPAAGWGSAREAVLPVVAMAAGPLAYLARIVHVEMVSVLDAPYMTTARSKRLPPRIRYLRHAVPNMLTSALTIGGLMLTGLIAATVLIETVFAIPGLGLTIASSISAKDYPMIQGVVLVYAVLVLVMNLVVDLVLMTVDPRSSIAEG